MEKVIIYGLGFAIFVFLIFAVMEGLREAGHGFWKGTRQHRETRRKELEHARFMDAARQEETLLRVRKEHDRKEPRVLAERFYTENAAVLRDRYPPALFDSFLRLEMSGDDIPSLWRAYRQLVLELKPLIEDARKTGRERERQQNQRSLRLKQINAEIAACRQAMARLDASNADPQLKEDEKQGQTNLLRDLERQKEELLFEGSDS